MTILGPDRDPLLADEQVAAPVEDIPEPEPQAKRWNRRGLLGALICFGAAGVTMVASFLKLCSAELTVGRGQERDVLTVTSWRVDPSTQFDPLLAVSNGVPLVFGLVLVAFGGVAGLLAAAPTAQPGMRRLAGVLAAVGAAFLAGAVWTVGMQVSSMVTSFEALSEQGLRGLTIVATVGNGFWLLLGAALAAILGMVLTFLPPSAGRRGKRAALAGGGAVVWQMDDEEDQERVEPSTPSVGLPVELDDPLDLPQAYSPEPTL